MEILKVDIKNKNGILLCSPSLLKMIREKFSVKNTNYTMRHFSSRVYSITPGGAFKVGLWHDIESYVRSLGIALKVVLTNEFLKAFSPKLGVSSISKIQGVEYYDYQEHTLNECISNGRGIALLATGAGKSVIIGGLCKTLIDNNPNIKILITVPNTNLLNQLYGSLVTECNIDSVTMWGDKNIPDLSKNILIANNQILTSDVKKTLKIVENYDALIVDEVHTIADKKTQIGKVIHNIKTNVKFGFTGTLPNKIEDSWNVIGKIGPIIYEKTSYEIRQQGTITDIHINVLYCIHKDKPKFVKTEFDTSPRSMYDKELNYIHNCSGRNELIKKLSSSLEGNILILVDSIKYGEILLEALSSIDKKKVFFVRGETDTDDRKKITDMMETDTGVICIAMSTIFSTGVSVKNLHYAIFTYIGKSTVKIVQSIGRTVRKHPSKNKAIIFDIADCLHYSKKHLQERLGIYKDQKINFDLIKQII